MRFVLRLVFFLAFLTTLPLVCKGRIDYVPA
jgi:hypothetical protein